MNCSKKAQMKIQQMAFMLVAAMVFFGMVSLVYFMIVLSKIHDSADDLREEEAKELARKMSGTPELAFSKRASIYSSSLDFDKALYLSKDDSYKKNHWNLDYLMIEKTYPINPSDQEYCTESNYPNCKKLIIIDKTDGNRAGTQTSPLAIVWWDKNLGVNGDFRFGLGRIHTLANEPKK